MALRSAEARARAWVLYRASGRSNPARSCSMCLLVKEKLSLAGCGLEA